MLRSRRHRSVKDKRVARSLPHEVTAAPTKGGRSDARPRVLVTLEADDGARILLDEVLCDVASLEYLSSLSVSPRRAALEQTDALLTWNIARELADGDWAVLGDRDDAAGPSLLIQSFLAGVEHVPFARVPTTALVAGNAGGWAEPMAEYVVAVILALFKRLLIEHIKMRAGEFNESLPTRELRAATCAILGFGHVGQTVASLLRSLGVRILALNTSGATSQPVDFIGTLADLEHVLRQADALVITLPLTSMTRDLVGNRELAWMRENAVLVNVARAGIVNEEALYRHLVAHPQFSAALDVWWDEPFPDGEFHVAHGFLDLPNVIGSPHNSGIVHGWFALGLRRAAENVRRYLVGEPIVGLVRREDYSSGPQKQPGI